MVVGFSPSCAGLTFTYAYFTLEWGTTPGSRLWTLSATGGLVLTAILVLPMRLLGLLSQGHVSPDREKKEIGKPGDS